MNRNPKEKFARLEIRVKPKDKEKIKRLAEKCNLSVSEYVVQRALGTFSLIVMYPNLIAELISNARLTAFAILFVFLDLSVLKLQQMPV